MPENMIRIWRFLDAPAKYSRLSQNGGDEDWVAYIPDALADDWIPWLEAGTSFGCFKVEIHDVPGGEIRIGSHS